MPRTAISEYSGRGRDYGSGGKTGNPTIPRLEVHGINPLQSPPSNLEVSPTPQAWASVLRGNSKRRSVQVAVHFGGRKHTFRE